MMKVAVIGAGAIGSVLGGLLADAGEEVTLIGRQAHIHYINEHGLQIDGALGSLHVTIQATEKLDFVPDLALLCVKTQDIVAAAKENKPWLAGVPTIAMQNGVQAENLAASVLGKENMLGGVVLFGATFLEPGKVIYSPAGHLVVGESFGSAQKRTKVIGNVLNKAIPTAVTANIQGAHWTKLIINETNALPAITGLSFQDVYANPYLRTWSVRLMREALDVITAAGNTLASLPEVPARVLKLLLYMPMPTAGLLPRLFSRALGDSPALGSTLQSIERGKPTEIDYLNGEIVALGEKTGRPTPYNTLIVALVHEVEQQGVFFTPQEVKLRLQTATKGS
jgi:2-dehydropantoate 2-reductase